MLINKYGSLEQGPCWSVRKSRGQSERLIHRLSAAWAAKKLAPSARQGGRKCEENTEEVAISPLLKILTEQAQRIQQLLIKCARLSEEYEVHEGGASGHDKIDAGQSLSGTSR